MGAGTTGWVAWSASPGSLAAVSGPRFPAPAVSTLVTALLFTTSPTGAALDGSPPGEFKLLTSIE